MKALFQKIRRWVSPSFEVEEPVSTGYEILGPDAFFQDKEDAWHQKGVSARQDAAYRNLLRQMYAGNVRQDLKVAADAIRCTGLENPSVLEVGCGSGYYCEILGYLLKDAIRYTGLDLSKSMIDLARHRYDRSFVLGDATALPFAEGSFDIVLNGVSLMHIFRYESAIKESRRAARHWCIFHTVPVLTRRKTTVLRKKAYGEKTIEIIFNETELFQHFEDLGLRIRHSFDSVPYNLESVLGEATGSKTYVCEIMKL